MKRSRRSLILPAALMLARVGTAVGENCDYDPGVANYDCAEFCDVQSSCLEERYSTEKFMFVASVMVQNFDAETGHCDCKYGVTRLGGANSALTATVPIRASLNACIMDLECDSVWTSYVWTFVDPATDSPPVDDRPEEKWPQLSLVGMSGEDAKVAVLDANPSLIVEIIPEGIPVTADFSLNRVRIFIDARGRVTQQPTIG